MPLVHFHDLNLIDYQQAWDLQEQLFKEIIDIKIANRKRADSGIPVQEHTITPNHLLFCEHPHVYTLGKSGDAKNMLLSEELLKAKNATLFHINRGGDITYHGPGQLVGYPILDLEQFFTDIHKYMRLLEESIILTLAEYGIAAGRIAGKTGVWLNTEDPARARKSCAMGVRCSRWVTMHGFAFNVNTDMNYFNYIVPCGITDSAVTSLQAELGRPIDLSLVKTQVLKHLAALFAMEIAG